MIRFLSATGSFCGLGSPFAFVININLSLAGIGYHEYPLPLPPVKDKGVFLLVLVPNVLSWMERVCSYPSTAFILRWPSL